MIMEAGKLQTYLQNLEDYVFIEEKIVTCVWLCQALKIHVNTAKQLLHAFIGHNEGKNKLLVTYLIGGELKDGSGKRLKLVEESDRGATKNLFSKLTADHVFSLQKCGNNINSGDVFNAYPHFLVNTEGRRFCTVQPSHEVEKRQIKVPLVEVKKEIAQPPSKVSKVQEKNEDKPKSIVDEPPSKKKKPSPEKNNKVTSKAKSGGIAGMFSRQTEKKKTEAPKEEIKNENKTEPKKGGGISGFLQKQPAKQEKAAIEPMVVDRDPPIKETNNKIEEKQKVVQENGDNASKKPENNSQKTSVKDKKLKGKENRKKRKKRDEEKEDDSRKKRKRIVSILSSDSESSENEENEPEMEPEPIPPEVPIVEEEEDIIPPTPGRKRVRKQIDKTYTDEDGFILTKKEYVYESCTDDEANEEKKEKEKVSKTNGNSSPSLNNEENPTNKKSTNEKKSNNEKGSSKKQISPGNNKNNKQASIMNFFKRK